MRKEAVLIIGENTVATVRLGGSVRIFDARGSLQRTLDLAEQKWDCEDVKVNMVVEPGEIAFIAFRIPLDIGEGPRTDG